MNIICHGCSFTKYSWTCWPGFLQWFVEEKVINKGQIGSGNDSIARETLKSVYEYELNHVYIMWSGVNRYEVWQSDGNIKVGGHPDFEKHQYYVKHFLNANQDMYNTLEKILLVQMFLESKKINYTMMTWKGDIIDKKSKLYNDIDWTKFVFYKDDLGLWENSQENFSHYYLEGELHPPPIAHYHWVKDVLLKSKIVCPENEYNKLKKYFKG